MSGPNFYRSPEFRIVLALSVVAGVLAFGVLSFVAKATDLLLLDFREWRPVVSGRSPEEARVAFDTWQSPYREQRPLRLTLRLDPAAAPGAFVAAERDPDSSKQPRCLRVLAFSPEGGPGAVARVLADGAVRASFPANGSGIGRLIEVRLRPGARLRFELRGAPSVVSFESASLRECGPP